MLEPVRVALGERSYDVRFHAGVEDLPLAERLAGRRVVVVTDTNVGPLYLDALPLGAAARVDRIVIPAGEASKTWETAGAVLDRMLSAGIDRRTWVVALGGGVVGDLAGFCASVALRGLPWLQVPTSLLAMVDSAVGGKTAVDHPRGKNLIGSFYQPSAVEVPLGALATLPPEQRRCGLGEVVKTALLAGEPLWSQVAAWDDAALGEIVRACVAYKAAIVASDERDTGARAVLNLGHTVGHALEQRSGWGLQHGEAVAIGLVVEARAAVKLGVAPPELPDRIAAVLTALGLQTALPCPLGALADAMRLDKKADGDIVGVPLPTGIGGATVVRLSAAALIAAAEPSS